MAQKLFVGGLSFNTTNDGLRDFFAQSGTVVSATVVTERFSGRSKGFGRGGRRDSDRGGYGRGGGRGGWR